jgi:hypothetical protein
MVDSINTSSTPSVGLRDQVSETGQTKGAPKPNGPGTDNTPGEVERRQQDGRPQNDPPRLDPRNPDQRYQAIVDKLTGGSEGVDMSILMQRVQELQQELGREQQTTQTNELKNNQKLMENNAQAQLKKIDAQSEELVKQGTWDTVKKVFSVAAAVLGVIAAIGASIASGGVGVPLIVASIGCLVTVAQTFGLTDKVFDLMGASQGVRTGVMLGITIALALVGGVSAFTGIGNTFAQGASLSAKIMGSLVKMGGTIVQGVAKGVEGAGAIGSAVVQGDLNKIEDDRKSLQRNQLRMKQSQEDLMEDLKKLMQAMEEGVKITTQVVQSQSQSVQTSLRHMS